MLHNIFPAFKLYFYNLNKELYYKNMNTTNKAINFQSDRGNDIYRENEVIRIKLDPGSAPLVNTQDSYLMFSLKMGANNIEPSAYMIPDPALGGLPFEQITIMDGNENTLLEQMDNVGLWSCMRNYYGNNVNDEHLQSIYEGRTKEINPKFLAEDAAAGAVNRLVPVTGGGATAGIDDVQPSEGGGFGSQYYQISKESAPTNGRKVQVIYRFPMSGLLSAMKSELLPLVVLNGLVLKITLMEGAKFLRFQQCEEAIPNAIPAAGVGLAVGNKNFGYGIIDYANETQTMPDTGGGAYADDKSAYGLYGYLDNVGAVQAAGIPAAGPPGTAISGIILGNTADGLYGMPLDDVRNCSLKPGGFVGIGASVFNAAVQGIEAPGLVEPSANAEIASVSLVGGRVHILFKANINADPLGFVQGSPVVAYIIASVLLRGAYEVSDVQMVCNVVEAPGGYIEQMVKQAQSGQLKIQYNSYRDERVNINTGSISNEIFIPTDLQRCYCILAVNEELRARSFYRSDFIPSRANLFNYQWIMNGTNTPNIPVSLTRVANNQVSPLQIIELEKAIDESSIRIRNIQNPGEFMVIGRRLGAYGDSVSLLDKTIKCRINYSPTQPLNLLYHFYIYHTKTIMFEGGSRVVLQ